MYISTLRHNHNLNTLSQYAPKEKQTHSLCSDPQSICDAAYGFSIGRGSFKYAAGGWTHVRQTVVLNTPGKQDGCFALDVNGKRVIDRTDVFYRDIPPPPKGSKPKPTASKPAPQPSGILGPILGNPVLGGLIHDAEILLDVRDEWHQGIPPLLLSPTQVLNKEARAPNRLMPAPAMYEIVTTTITVAASVTPQPNLFAPVVTVLLPSDDITEKDDNEKEVALLALSQAHSRPIGFTGIFFR